MSVGVSFGVFWIDVVWHILALLCWLLGWCWCWCWCWCWWLLCCTCVCGKLSSLFVWIIELGPQPGKETRTDLKLRLSYQTNGTAGTGGTGGTLPVAERTSHVVMNELSRSTNGTGVVNEPSRSTNGTGGTPQSANRLSHQTNGTNASRPSGVHADRASLVGVPRASGLAQLATLQAENTRSSARARPSNVSQQPGSDRTTQVVAVRPSAKVQKPASDRTSQAANVRPSAFLTPEHASRASRVSRSERPPEYNDRPSQYIRRSQGGERWTVRSIRSSVSGQVRTWFKNSLQAI